MQYRNIHTGALLESTDQQVEKLLEISVSYVPAGRQKGDADVRESGRPEKYPRGKSRRAAKGSRT